MGSIPNGTTIFRSIGPKRIIAARVSMNIPRIIKNIRIKLRVSCLLFILVLVGLFWRVLNPDVLVNMGSGGWVYLALSCSFAVLVGILGWFGAKMTFPH